MGKTLKRKQSTTKVVLYIPGDIYARIAARTKADELEFDDLLIRWILFGLQNEEKWGMPI